MKRWRTLAASVWLLLACMSAASQGHGTYEDVQTAKLALADVDLGELPLNVDREAVIEIVNTDNDDVEVRMVYLTDAVGGAFRLKQTFYPVILTPGSSTTVTVVVNLSTTGSYRTRLVASTDDNIPSDDTASAMISAHSVAPPDPKPRLRFALGNVTATVGEHIGIPLICVEGGSWLRDHQLSNVACDLRYRRSVLTCDFPNDNAVIDGAMRMVRVSLAPYQSTDVQNGDTILMIPMTACLGDMQQSSLEVSSIAFDLDTDDVDPDTVLSATVTIDDTWPGDGPRSVTRDTTLPAVQAYPNPSTGMVTLSLHGWQQHSEVRVHALDGTEVFSYTAADAEGITDLHLALHGALAPGAYVCTYRSNDHITHSSFIVLR